MSTTIPFTETTEDARHRRHEQMVSTILNSLIRNGWLVQTGRDDWELRIVPNAGGYFEPSYFNGQYFSGQYFKGTS